jgi:hypothetical protein
MRVRDETAETLCEAHGAMNKEHHVCARRRVGEPAVSYRAGREASLNRMSTDRVASPSAWPCKTGGQACRSGVPAVGVEALMNNAG